MPPARSSARLTVNAVNGVATFTNLAIDTAGTYSSTASNPDLTTGTSTSITINPAAPAQLSGRPSPRVSTTEGIAFGATLDVEDQYGNLETGDNQNVSLSLDLNGTPTLPT